MSHEFPKILAKVETCGTCKGRGKVGPPWARAVCEDCFGVGAV